MPGLTEQTIGCPCCGETVLILVDDSQPVQCYIEDCEVCCRPVVLDVTIGPDGEIAINAWSENE